MFNLFAKYPVINYGNDIALNILARLKFTSVAKKTGAIYYPYTILNGERADLIAANYYDDPRYSWLIYFANDIVDPLHDWPLTDEEFTKYITNKYGSIAAATETIMFWRVNWYDDDTMLSVAGYEALPAASKKYFNPMTGTNSRIVGYERAHLTTAVETNKIQELTVLSSDGFAVGETLIQQTSGTTTANAVVRNIINNTLTVNHVFGEFAATEGTVGNIVGSTSKTSSALTTVQTIATPIPSGEFAYWASVNALDYETELNEQKRHIKLVDKAYVDQIESEIAELL